MISTDLFSGIGCCKLSPRRIDVMPLRRYHDGMREFVLAAVMLITFGCGSSADQAAAPVDVAIEVGKPFPDLVLPALDGGGPASIADLRGKKTLLHVFASW